MLKAERPYLVEFLVVAGIVIVTIFCMLILAIAHVSEPTITEPFRNIITAGFGALIALAYAARGGPPKGGAS